MTRHLLVSFGDRNIIVFPSFFNDHIYIDDSSCLLDNTTQCDKY